MARGNVTGRDLVAIALADPPQILNTRSLREVVLGRTAYVGDIDAMVRRATKDQFRRDEQLIIHAAQPEVYGFPATLDAWRLIVCDVPRIEESQDLKTMYKARLAEEAADAGRACERAYEDRGREDGEAQCTMAHLFFRESGSCGDRFAIGGGCDGKYMEACIATSTGMDPADRGGASAMGLRIFPNPRCGATIWQWLEVVRRYEKMVRSLYVEVWPDKNAKLMDGDEEIRAEFRSNRTTLSLPGILRNTFIVINGSTVPEDYHWITGNRIFDFWVWAFDADWDPSSPEQQAKVDGEIYEGDVKVSYYSPNAWFYAARREGVSLRDMWLKAQQHPLKQWICFS